VEKVLGIGGLFFRSKDPQKLAQWYQDHLGIVGVPQSAEQEPWRQEAGTTVFAPFEASSDYFGDLRNQWMVNFRVRDLDAMVAQLRGAGIVVELNPEADPNGRFARLYDLDGNPIELWQPAEDRG
jgi:glyoxylase I family protein